ncbi:DUF4350 domain-containing protein [Agromyces archimandritae]|uniref:DUF4350 domain-containing protein n=1 Tax=Agromyces archimandritae TaxID=2781962 RepID=A0A975FPE9_9MICO|nr:DUF4350 domain-containing protein [Agromyces archimandritae]QTX05233.1 DUF4350 domain-containing protein [Agromyces archimandritae]
MTTEAQAAPAPAVSRTLGGVLRRGRTWIVIAAGLLVAAVVIMLVQGGVRGPGRPLAADNPAPAGAQALAEVLGDHGVRVQAAGSLNAALGAAGEDAAVFVSDPDGYLDADALGRLAASTGTLVVAGPHANALDALAPGVHHAGAADGAPSAPGCRAPVADGIDGLGEGLGVLSVGSDAAADGWTGCFPDDAGRPALALGPGIALAPAALFDNEHIAEAGNAALAIRLLGGHDRLVWYLPGLDDVAGDDAPSLAEITPGWVSPVLVLLGIVTVWAAVWRGRRFGPLVAERLPVVVPAEETSEGRARLYERSGSRGRALDQLRMGALQRLAADLGLGRSAGLEEVCGGAAAATGRTPASVRGLLVENAPDGDGDFVRLARAIAELEGAVAEAVRPGGRAAASAGAAAAGPAAPHPAAAETATPGPAPAGAAASAPDRSPTHPSEEPR